MTNDRRRGPWSLVIGHWSFLASPSDPAARQAWSLAGRGFILFRTGFFGGGTRSHFPPLPSTFSLADLEKWWALITSFLVTSPVPRIRTPSSDFFASPFVRSDSTFTSSPAAKTPSMSPTLTTLY